MYRKAQGVVCIELFSVTQHVLVLATQYRGHESIILISTVNPIQ